METTGQPAFFTGFRVSEATEAVQKAVDTRRATEDPAGVLKQYVEESEEAQRSRHGFLRRRSRRLVRNAGWQFTCRRF
jgi:hypothetical protein